MIAPSLLPKIHDSGAPNAPLSAACARYFQLSPDAMVHAGTTDSIVAFLASAPLIRARPIGLWPKAARQSEASAGTARLAQSASA